MAEILVRVLEPQDLCRSLVLGLCYLRFLLLNPPWHCLAGIASMGSSTSGSWKVRLSGILQHRGLDDVGQSDSP